MAYGGVYRKRPVLCTGHQGSGKTLLALHALMQAVKEGEQALMLTSWHANDLVIVAEKTLGFGFEEAITRGHAILLEYAGIMPTPDFEKNVTLPPASFTEFMQIVETRSVTRVIIDTVLPWVAIRQKERLSLHVYSFMQALERMGVTALLTLPKPVSPLAFMLKNLLEEQVPIALTLKQEPEGSRTLTVNKYLGETVLPPPLPFEIRKGTGLASVKPDPASPGAPGKDGGSDVKSSGPIRFASAFRSS
ncbi:MAG: hypothetical protein A2498_09510 [Lentisphaerae bacterium RIFOXYC12_FULL_60_16]|nr:MAG: hypothetical protein A2498_09510 [Lentisphaerae bacterium RIFOXYC12_FULL_60_16]OGV75396.1 MAG: hypothetical protein A2340_13355 [Lentisphaerae bacterium RIFOXYB12_FULL_60_10]